MAVVGRLVLVAAATAALALGAAVAGADEPDAVEAAAPAAAESDRTWASIASDDPRVIAWVTAWRWETAEDYAAAKAADAEVRAFVAEAGAPGSTEATRGAAARLLLSVLREDIPLQHKRAVLRQVGLIAPGALAPAIARYLIEPDLAEDARMALAKMPAVAATDALIDGIERVHADALPGLLRTLGRRGDMDAAVPLLGIAQQQRGPVRWAAFRALVALGIVPPAIFPASPDLEPREARQYALGAFQAAAALQAMGESGMAADVYERLAQAPIAAHLTAATLNGLAETGSERALLHALAFLGDRNLHDTAMAVLEASTLPGTDERLAQAFEVGSPIQQASLMRVLAARDAVPLAPVLAAAGDAADPLVRATAALISGEAPGTVHLVRAREAYPVFFAQLVAWMRADAEAAAAAGDAALAAALHERIDLATQPPVTPLTNAHAHNDYEHPRPLLDALDHGFTSIEADVFVVDGDLLVAHEAEDLTPERTLRGLYLDPLLARVRAHGGRVYPNGPPIILLVDIKSEAEEAYAVLRRMLPEYGEMLTAFTDEGIEERAVRVILSGNRPTETVASEPRRLVAIDGRLDDLDADPPVSLVPLVSMPWHTIARVRRDAEEIPAEAIERMRAFAERAHAQGRITRLWASPEHPASWDAQIAAGLDLINIDDLGAFRRYMDNR